MEISDNLFRKLELLIKSNSGITIKREDSNILKNKLVSLMNKKDINDLDALENFINENAEPDFIEDLVNLVTTSETLFFRDIKVFNALENAVFPEIIKNKKGDKIKIWSAACATGQEPYSISMMIDSSNNPIINSAPYSIFATDINRESLNKAEKSLYSQFEVQRGLPISMLLKYFTKEGDQWLINKDLKEHTTFKQFNLLDNLPGSEIFDIIFCRNVFLYFDLEVKLKILNSFYQHMDKNSVLVLGSSENLMSLETKFIPYQDIPSIFCLK